MFENRAHWADKAFWWVAPIVVVAAAAGGLYYYFHSRHNDVNETSVPVEPTPVARTAEPAIKHPLPQSALTPQEKPEPLPALTDSDAPLQSALEKIFGATSVQKSLVPDGLVRRIVVTVDNLPRQKLAVEQRPVKALEGQTQVTTSGELITLSEANYARYSALVGLVGRMDAQQLGNVYFRYYPLLQQSYEELGYPGQYFNDRLVEAIDSLLATPELAAPIELTQPHVFYEFADPSLEIRPAGQKLLLRMGRENAAVIKQKLKELRRIVTTGRDPPADADPRSGGAAPPSKGAVSPPGGVHHWL